MCTWAGYGSHSSIVKLCLNYIVFFKHLASYPSSFFQLTQPCILEFKYTVRTVGAEPSHHKTTRWYHHAWSQRHRQSLGSSTASWTALPGPHHFGGLQSPHGQSCPVRTVLLHWAQASPAPTSLRSSRPPAGGCEAGREWEVGLLLYEG